MAFEHLPSVERYQGWFSRGPTARSGLAFLAHTFGRLRPKNNARNGATIRVGAAFRQDTPCAVGYVDPRCTEGDEAGEALDFDLLTDL
eukprot:2866973-Pyramimonas_sp.AAC.1